MTFPDHRIADAAVMYLAGPDASRAAIYTAKQKYEQVIDAICVAEAAAPRFIDVSSYDATAKLERESGGDKAATWEGVKVQRHDHAMCDPDRKCGPDNAAPEGTYVGAWTESELERMVNSEHPGARRLAEASKRAQREDKPRLASFFKDTSPAAEAEQAAMQRMHEAEDLKNSLRWEAGEAAIPAQDHLNWLTAHLSAGADPIDASGRDEDCCATPAGASPEGEGPPPADRDPDAHVHEVKLDTHWPEGSACEEGANPRLLDDAQKLRLIADTVTMQQPLGTDLARFRNRLAAILAIQ